MSGHGAEEGWENKQAKPKPEQRFAVRRGLGTRGREELWGADVQGNGHGVCAHPQAAGEGRGASPSSAGCQEALLGIVSQDPLPPSPPH